MEARRISTRWTTALGALAGVVAAIVALGVAELIAGIRAQWRSPVIDVGDRVIDNVPVFVKEFAIDTFGTNDKPALLIGIGVTLLLYAAVIGALSFRSRIWIGLAGIGVFGLIGAAAAITNRAGGSLDDAVPTVVGALTGAAALWLAHRVASPVLQRPVDIENVDVEHDVAELGDVGHGGTEPSDVEPSDVEPSDVEPSDVEMAGVVTGVAETNDVASTATRSIGCESAGTGSAGTESAAAESPTDPARGTRRELLVRSGGVLAGFALLGAGAGTVGRKIRSRFSATESRMNVALPRPTDSLAQAPDAVSVGVDGVAPFFTPNNEFYRIDTALTVPQVPTEGYQLRVNGMVDNELSLSFDELLKRNVEEHDITLTCVSNTVGGELIGNARWLGVRLDELLEEAGVRPGADQVVGRSIDGYTCGFPLEAATDGRNALVAFGMNGEPLPLEHGFPVRLIVPGLYGYISATKWLTEIELTTFEEFEQYWVPRGYAERAPINHGQRSGHHLRGAG